MIALPVCHSHAGNAITENFKSNILNAKRFGKIQTKIGSVQQTGQKELPVT